MTEENPDSPASNHLMTVGRFQLRVRLTGDRDAEPLLLLMGIGGNLEMWDPLQRQLPGRRLISFDIPGTGGSSRSRLPLPMVVLARITSRLIRELGYEQVDVLGLSWGGGLAQQLAITHRRRVRRLVLAATLPGIGSIPGRPKALWILATPRRYYSRDYFEAVAPTLYGGDIKSRPDLMREHATARLTRPPTLGGYLNQLFAMSTFSSLPFLPVIDAPTLVLAGDDDPIVPLANGRILQHGIRRAELYVLKGGGHLFLFERAEECGKVIEAFLSEPDAPKP